MIKRKAAIHFYFYIITVVSISLALVLFNTTYKRTKFETIEETAVNLVTFIKSGSYKSAGNISAVEPVSDQIVVTGSGKIVLSGESLNLNKNDDYIISADIMLLGGGYRRYSTVLLQGILNKNSSSLDSLILNNFSCNWLVSTNISEKFIGLCNRILKSITTPHVFESAESDVPVFNINQTQTIWIGPFKASEISQSNIVLMDYDRFAWNNDYKPQQWIIKGFSISQVDISPAETLPSLNFLVAVALCFAILAIGSVYFLQGSDNIDAVTKITLLNLGVLVLLSVSILSTFPISELRLRADAWSYDLVARSLYAGYGFKAYNIPEVTSYPIVPIYYWIFYKILGVSTVSVFWANFTLIAIAWIAMILYFHNFSPKFFTLSLILLIIDFEWMVPLGWVSTETIAMVSILLFVIVALYVTSITFKIYSAIIMGSLLGVCVLARTDYYGLVPIAIMFFFIRMKIVDAIRMSISVIFVTGLCVSPWIYFQSINEPASVHAVMWASDISRIKEISSKIYNGSNLSGNSSLPLLNFSRMVLLPYNNYVSEVLPFGSQVFRIISFMIHPIFIICSCLFVVSKLGFRYSMWRGLPALVSSIVVLRTLFISQVHDSPRYFSHTTMLVVLLVLYGVNLCYKRPVTMQHIEA